LKYNRFRYYDPATGRYVSADPIGQLREYRGAELQVALSVGLLQSTASAGSVLNHLFNYVESNPTGWIDPHGLAQKTFDLGGGTTVRIDQPHVPEQQRHAHVTTPKGEVVVNEDGSQSHRSRGNLGNLTNKAKRFLRLKGFLIPSVFDFLLNPCLIDPSLPGCKSPDQCPVI
jgi:hypothetical protein